MRKTIKSWLIIACLLTGFAPVLSAQETIYEDVPDMPESDILAVMNWIKNKATGVKLPYCYRQSFGRGAGVVGNTCPPGLVKDPNGALCYPQCSGGYYAVGPVCWQSCPSGYRDDGAFCAKPSEYGRGAGYPWKVGDKPFNYDKARERCERDNPQGCEKDGLIYYPKCRSGFHKVGCCVCSPDCPPGFGADIGVSCTKKTYGNGAGSIMNCPVGTERDATGGPAGLCYPTCKAGFYGVGPVCWQTCDAGWTECGAGCARTAVDCASNTVDMVVSVLTVAANIATLGLSSAGSGAANAGKQTLTIGSKTFTSSTKTGEYLIKALNMVQTVKPEGLVKNATVIRRVFQAKTGTNIAKAMTTLKVAANTYKIGKDFYSTFADDFVAQTSQQINDEINSRFNPLTARYLKEYWANVHLLEMANVEGMKAAQDALSVISIVDITGVSGVVSAFTRPICQDVIPFPTLSQSYK